METEVLEKIFTYNKRWLFDRDKTFNTRSEEYLRKKFNVKKSEKGGVISGNLIKNNLATEVKTATQREVIESNPSKNKKLLNEIETLSDYCVLTNLYRFKKCSERSLSRPLVAFLTTKRNSLKLKYLENQNVKFSYLCIDYDKVKFGKKKDVKLKESECTYKEGQNPINYAKFRKSKKFKNNLVKKLLIPEGNEIEELIPIEISPKDPDLKDPNRFDPIGRYLNVCSDYYYKTEIFEFFRDQVRKKLKLEINLDDWCYCIVFPDQWCSKEFLTEETGNSIFYFFNNMIDEFNSRYFSPKELPEMPPFGREKMNNDTTKGNVDITLLNFIISCFKSPEIAEKYIYSEIGELKDFGVVEHAFKKFPDGGYWIKKISYKKDKYIEETEGPYDEKEGEKRVRILKNIMELKDVPVAKLYKFEDLACKNDILQIEGYSEIGRYVKPEDRWTPPEGPLLFCLAHRMRDVAYFSRKNLTREFKSFSDYAINSGMKFLGTPSYYIFYDPDSEKSLRKASNLRNLFNHEGVYKNDHFLWLLDAVLEKSTKRGSEPEIKPFPVSDISQSKDKITYEELKKLFDVIDDLDCSANRVGKAFEEMKKAFDFGFVETYKNEEDSLKITINSGVVMDKTDTKPKEFRITKSYDDTHEIAIKKIRKRFNDINLVSVTEIKDCVGYLNINFKNMKDKTWDVSRLSLFNGDIFFNNEVVLIMLTLFVAKCFGVKVVLMDTRSKPTECENKILIQYYIIYYLGIGNFNKFKELGFVILEEEEYNSVMDKSRGLYLKEFFENNRIGVKIPKELENHTISEFCREYLESKICPPKIYLNILNKISEELEKNVFLKIFNNLEDLDFNFIEKYITHVESLE